MPKNILRDCNEHSPTNLEAKNTGVLLVSQIASYIIGFFFIMYTARYLGAGGFGILSFALAFTGIFGVFSDLSLKKEVAINRKFYKDNTLIRHNMNKNIYLSRQEQMIFNLISTLDMAYSEEIEEVFSDLKPRQINKMLHDNWNAS